VADANWLTSYPPGVPTSIDPDAYPSLHALLLDACRRYGERPAFDCLSATVSYAEWDRVSRSFAAFLREAAKSQPGDRIAIMLPNVLAYPVAFLGSLRAGLTVVNVNPLYTPRELEHKDSGAKLIVVMENFAHKLATVITNTPIACGRGASWRPRTLIETMGS
jgi:long-chain acyl-CoA synthetase